MGCPYDAPPLSGSGPPLSMSFSHVAISAIMLLFHGSMGSYSV
jgi:hypothetical protein